MAEFAAVKGLANDATLNVVHDRYNDRAVRIHVTRLRELVFPSKTSNTFVQTTTDISSPSFFTDVIKAATDHPQKAPSNACTFSRSDLGTIYCNPSTTQKPADACLHSITWSGWSPPPGKYFIKKTH